MGDHSNKTLQLQNSRWFEDILYARNLFYGKLYLNLDGDSLPWLLNHINAFDEEARINENIEIVNFWGYLGEEQDDEVWDKLGQAIGNLQALKSISILTPNNHKENEDLPNSDWEKLVRILSQVRQKTEVKIVGDRSWNAEESRLVAQAIHGHPTIVGFTQDTFLPYGSLDVLYSALATLPALESISLLQRTAEHESTLVHPESLTELLRLPSLRSVCFDRFNFTPALCQATANALMEGTAITDLAFILCSFSGEESATMMATGLSRNTSLSDIKVNSSRDQVLFGVLATALPSNSALQSLELWEDGNDDPEWSPVLLALGRNARLKHVSVIFYE
jgi:hypothetical protein